MTDQLWGTLREELKSTLGRNNFTTWIEPLELTHLKGGVATFRAPSSFVGNWVERNFAEHIRSLLEENGSPVDRLEFAVEKSSDTATMPPQSSPKPGARVHRAPHPEPADDLGAPLDARFSFEKFVVGKPNEPGLMPPRAAWPKADRRLLIPSFFTAALVLARPT